MTRALLLSLLLVACGSSPTAPTQPSTTIPITLVEALTGAHLGTVSREAPSLTRLTLEWPGYVPRGVKSLGRAMTVDLIPDDGRFDLDFYREFARGALDGDNHGLLTLTTAPRFYVDTRGFSPERLAIMRAAAEAALPAFTGGRFNLTTWVEQDGPRDPMLGEIRVMVSTEPGVCGRADLGAAAGRIWLAFNNPGCQRYARIMTHEIGHALGFSHVSADGHVMQNPGSATTLSVAERYHAAIAYSRPRGNTDVDVDP